MTVKGRIHAIRLSDKIKKNPEYAEKIGISYNLENNSKNNQRRQKHGNT